MAQYQLIRRECPGQDLISELPNEILIHILTYVPRKYAIRTSVLSSNWKDLWKQRSIYPIALTFGRATETEKDQQVLAEEIHEKMREHGNKTIEKFSLSFYPGKKHEQMAAEWVEQAATNGVQELYLDFAQGCMGSYPSKQLLSKRAKKFQVRECLFKCSSTLIILRLNCCRLHRYFKFKYFRCLETLCLRQVNINDSMLDKLVLNCLGLKSLELRQCLYLKRIEVPATLLSLKKLILAYCWSAVVIKISAPGLQTFYFLGDFPKYFAMIGNMPFLSDVIFMSPSGNPEANPELLAMRLETVQALTLCSWGVKAMFGLDNNSTSIIFDHLKELQLLMHMMASSDISNIHSLLTICQFPVLEKLFIELPYSSAKYGMMNDPQKLQDPAQKTFRLLKVIKMNNFRGLSNEWLLLDFLLQNAINLDRIILVLSAEFYTNTPSEKLVNLYNEVTFRQKTLEKAQILTFYACPDDYGYRAGHSNAVRDLERLRF